MNTALNNQLSPLSKVWIYQSNRPFTETEAAILTERINSFVKQWTAHKLEVSGDGALLYNRFIVLMADETHVGVSGCSVDSSVHFIRNIGTEFNVNFFDRWNIAYKKNGEVLSCSREEFSKLVETGIITDETIVFNNLVQTKAELETKWEVAYKNSWVKNLGAVNTSFSSVL